MKKRATVTEPVAESTSPVNNNPTKTPASDPTCRPVRKCSLMRTIFWLLLLVLIAAAVAGGYCARHYLKASQQSIQQLREQTTKLEHTVASQADVLTHEQQVLSQIQQQLTVKNRPWVLAEVQHLIRLANFSLRVTRGIPLSLSLLETADQRLASMDDATVLPLRNALAQDISNLKAMPQEDMTGLLLKLNAQMEQIPQLPLRLQEQTTPLSAATSKNATTPTWRELFDKSWAKLKSMVVITRQQDNMAFFNPDQNRAYADRYLQLLLTEAQWGVLQRQQPLFEKNLQSALVLLHQFYQADAAQTTAMINTLTELAKVNVSPDIPDLKTSVLAVEKAIDEQASTHNTADTAQPDTAVNEKTSS